MTDKDVTSARGSAAGRPSALNIPGVVMFGRTSLTLTDSLAVDDWLGIGLHLWRTMDSSAWWLGDWLVYGRDRYSDRYKEAISNTALDYQTLRNYAWVSGRIEVTRRRGSLSFQHHAEVASLPGTEQDEWLAKADTNRWSRNRLRAEMRAVLKRGSSEVRKVQVRLHDERLALWRRAAEREGQDLLPWIVRKLDEEAGLAT
ncbi:MAG: LmbU family transcriptional regulator [Streptosporangiaceae bacterium]